MKKLILAMVLSLTLIAIGCTKTIVEEKRYGPDGTLIGKRYTEDDKVLYELKRILEKETIRGKGKFKNENEAMARVAATNLAINDLAARAGEVIATQNVTLYNDKIYSVIQTKSRNIVKGYDVIFEKWDEGKQEFEIIIEMRGYKIAEEIAKTVR